MFDWWRRAHREQDEIDKRGVVIGAKEEQQVRTFKVVRLSRVGQQHQSASFQSTDTESVRIEFEIIGANGFVELGDEFTLTAVAKAKPAKAQGKKGK